MIDIVSYNKGTGYNVVPHVDPGLISISVYSDC